MNALKTHSQKQRDEYDDLIEYALTHLHCPVSMGFRLVSAIGRKTGVLLECSCGVKFVMPWQELRKLEGPKIAGRKRR